MKRVEYKLLSGTESNPIKVVVDADKTSATICWTYNLILEQDNCNTCNIAKNECAVVELTPLECGKSELVKGHIDWYNDIKIYYEITQKEVKCPCEEHNTTTCELIDSWVIPYNIECSESCGEKQKTTLYYSYYEITRDCCDKILNRTKVTKSKEIEVDCCCDKDDQGGIHEGTATVKLGTSCDEIPISYSYNCVIHKEETCSKEEEVAISTINYYVNSKPVSYVSCSGATVGYEIIYQITNYDEYCNRIENQYISGGTWVIDKCQGEDCCKIHDVTLGGVKYYTDGNGKVYETTLTIQMMADNSGECNEDCNKKCTPQTCYIVDESGTTLYSSNGEWIEDGIVESYGGTVKVRFGYSSYTTAMDCIVTSGQNEMEIDVTVPEVLCDGETERRSDEPIEWIKSFNPFAVVCKDENGTVGYKVMQKNIDCHVCVCDDFEFIDPCECSDFEFLDPCSCDDFSFIEPCDCSDFEFIDPCSCDDFSFIEPCDCDSFEFIKPCDCEDLTIKKK